MTEQGTKTKPQIIKLREKRVIFYDEDSQYNYTI